MSNICKECEDPSWTGQSPIVAPRLPKDGGVEIVDELPEEGDEGVAYVLVDNIETPTKSAGIFIYQNGWLSADMPQNIQVVDELPDEGDPGYVYWLRKDESGSEDTYDLYQYINGEWRKIDVDIRLYSTTGSGIDGAMTQKATTDALEAYKGLAKELTAADYNYPSSGTKTAIDPYLLSPGIYTFSGIGLKNYDGSWSSNSTGTLIVSGDRYLYLSSGNLAPVYNRKNLASKAVITEDLVVDNLTSTSATTPLSAKQGKALKDTIDGLVVSNFEYNSGTHQYEGGVSLWPTGANNNGVSFDVDDSDPSKLHVSFGDDYVFYRLLSENSNILTTLSYGSSTWNDFITAYNAGKIVYCRASSNANPATGQQTRMAFMAYVSAPTNPTSVEFQYVRSVKDKSSSAQCDQVFVYKLTNANGGTWTVETRDMASTVVAGANATSTYSGTTITINPRLYTTTGQNTNGGVTQKLFTDTVGSIESALNIINNGGNA